MTNEELNFLKEHEVNFVAVELNYTRNIEFNILDQYIKIYQKYIDQNFILNAWCKHCVYDMIKRIKAYYDANNQPNTQLDVKTKNTRSRK